MTPAEAAEAASRRHPILSRDFRSILENSLSNDGGELDGRVRRVAELHVDRHALAWSKRSRRRDGDIVAATDLPASAHQRHSRCQVRDKQLEWARGGGESRVRSEEHTSELQSL